MMLRIPKDDPLDVIATRVLEVDGEPHIQIQLGRPRLVPEGSCWFCPYEVVDASTPWRSYACGEDAMQALVLTLYKISVEI